MGKKTSVAMCTYNGALYLSHQLASIAAQSYQPDELIVCDDGSDDSTLDVVKSFSRKAKFSIQVFINESRLGAVKNFEKCLRLCNNEFIALSDQDDVWLPYKLERQLEVMNELQRQHGSGEPLLVFSDLSVVDYQLNPISNSFYSYLGRSPSGITLNRLLMQNVVAGCSTLVNRSLINLVEPIPSQAQMHDWWLALIASAFGKISYIGQPMLLYRQHGSNCMGANKNSMAKRVRNVVSGGFNSESYRDVLKAKSEQASAFRKQFGHMLAPDQAKMVSDFARLYSSGFWLRRGLIVKNKFYTSEFLQNLELIIRA